MSFLLQLLQPLVTECIPFIFSVCIVVGFLRLKFHGLSSFPGPWYLAISDIPSAWLISRGRHFDVCRSLHAKYGSVVRIAPNELSFSKAEAIEDIYGLRSGGETMEKDPKWGLAGLPQRPFSLLTAPKEEHRRLRKALGMHFTNSALKRREAHVQQCIDQLIDILAQKRNARGEVTIDAQAWFRCLSFDMLGLLCLGQTLGCLESGQPTFMQAIVKSFTASAYTRAAAYVVGHGNWIHNALTSLITPKELLQTRAAIGAQAQTIILERFADLDESKDDFASSILRENQKQSRLTVEEIVTNLLSLLAGGGEGLGGALTEWASAMMWNEEAYLKLADEIHRSFTRADQLTWSAVNELPYLDAVIKEALRWQGSVSQKVRIVPDGGAKIDGHWVPGRTTVSLAAFTANHSEDNFSDPYCFSPERWLSSQTKDKLHASVPFSHGPRDCIGKNLAIMAMKLVIAHLLFRFELKTEGLRELNPKWDPANNFEHAKVLFTWLLPPLWITMRERTV